MELSKEQPKEKQHTELFFKPTFVLHFSIIHAKSPCQTLYLYKPPTPFVFSSSHKIIFQAKPATLAHVLFVPRVLLKLLLAGSDCTPVCVRLCLHAILRQKLGAADLHLTRPRWSHKVRTSSTARGLQGQDVYKSLPVRVIWGLLSYTHARTRMHTRACTHTHTHGEFKERKACRSWKEVVFTAGHEKVSKTWKQKGGRIL